MVKNLLFLVLVLLFSFGNGTAFGQKSLTFKVKKPARAFVAEARSNPTTIRRTYGSELVDLSIEELIDTVPATFVAGDYSFYEDEPFVIDQYRVVFQHDTSIIAIDQMGCMSNELVIVLDRMDEGKEFFIAEILVRNTETNKKFYLRDVVLQFRKP